MFREMRRSKQQVSRAVCQNILAEEKRAVLSVLGEEGYPYAVPVNFFYDRDEDTIYLHGAKTGHKLDAIAREDKVCFTTWNTGYQTPGSWEWNVTSVVVLGRATLVEDPALTREKVWQLALKYYPDREEARVDLQRNLHRVQLIAITPEHMTGKLVKER